MRPFSRFRLSEGLEVAARNTSATVVARASSMAATVGFTALFSRYVGVGGFGQYAYALSLATLLGGICGFGLDNWAIRELARSREQATAIVGRSLFLQFLLAVLSIVGLAVYFGAIRHDAALCAVTIIVGAYTFLDVSGLLIISVFRARQVMTFEAMAVIAGNVAMLVFTVLGMALHLGIRGVLLLVSLSYLFKFGVIVALAKRRCHLGSLTSELRPSLRTVRAGFPFLLTSLGNNLYYSYPRLVLAAFVTLPVIGLYAAAERVTTLIAVITGILDIVIYPVFANRMAQSRDAFSQAYQQVCDFTLVVGLLMGIGVACLLPEIIRVLFGSAYREAVPLALVLVPSISMNTLGYVNGRAMYVLHKEKVMSIATMSTTLGGIAVSLLATRYFGAYGMAATTVAASAFGYFYYFFYVRKKLDLPWITSRHLLFFALFPAAFAVAYVVASMSFWNRLMAGAVLSIALLAVFRVSGMLDWTNVLRAAPPVDDASPTAA